ncbi:MAG: rhomboid family intramembrane serine protease [Bacteroidales bacterium]|nr:rhomboid family intramembrane serine protease [Bacteroidales bacterium]
MTYLLIAFTVLVTLTAFRREGWFSRFQFNAYQIYHRKEIYRLLTHGFLHANWLHLIVNMLVLFFFGPYVENYLHQILPESIPYLGRIVYLLFYFAAIIISSLVSLYKQKDNAWYNAVGASGAVSAVLFFFIFFRPWEMLYFYGIIPIPGIIMGVLYLVYSYYMSRRGEDNINHDAHFIGAVFGFTFPLLIDYKLIFVFLNQLNLF